ncbi:Methyltransferase type 11 domain-containing protein [Plasmodiophora brassicae]
MMTEAALKASRAHWEGLALDFDACESLMTQSWGVLLEHLQLDGARQVLEVGAGRGTCASAILNRLPEGAQLTATDYTPVMVDIASKFLGVHPGLREVAVANAIDLSPFSNGQFDRYIANMTLHLVPDADAMLREARRVLSDDGIAAFSVWGRPEHSTIITANQKPGAGLSKEFDVGADLDALKKRILAAGFKRVAIWRQQCVYELWDTDNAVAMWARIEKRNTATDPWCSTLRGRFQAVIDRGDPIGLEAVVIVARCD